MRVCTSVYLSIYPSLASLAVSFLRDGLGPTDELPGLPAKPAIVHQLD